MSREIWRLDRRIRFLDVCLIQGFRRVCRLTSMLVSNPQHFEFFQSAAPAKKTSYIFCSRRKVSGKDRHRWQIDYCNLV